MGQMPPSPAFSSQNPLVAQNLNLAQCPTYALDHLLKFFSKVHPILDSSRVNLKQQQVYALELLQLTYYCSPFFLTSYNNF